MGQISSFNPATGQITLANPANGYVISAGLHVQNINAILQVLNGNLIDANVASGAAITNTKVTNAGVRVSTNTMGSDAASLNVSGISTAYTHMRLLIQARSAAAALDDTLRLYLDNVTSSVYLFSQIEGASGTPAGTSSSGTTRIPCGLVPAASSGSANDFSATDIWIFNYASTSDRRSLVIGGGYANSAALALKTDVVGAQWNDTTQAVNRVTFDLSSGSNLKTGTQLDIWLF